MDDQFETKAGYDAVNKYEKMRMSGSDIVCPFCGETDFDLVGLKHHLENYCEGYKNTPSPDNPCFGCEYRKPNEASYINICLLDEDTPCIKEV